MKTEVNKAVVRRLYEAVFEGGELDEADELLQPDVRDLGDPDDRRGPERVKAVARMLSAAFPDQHWQIEALVAEGDTVVMRSTHSGTHLGPFMGMAATGRAFSGVEHAYFFELRDGRVATYQAIRDDLSLLRQLGLIG